MISRLLLVLIILTLSALGDGGFKSGQLLLPVMIPQQTAVMWHQDGKETLSIWNTVEAANQELAWVLPLPAVPEIIEGTDAAALRTIRMMAAPTLTKNWGKPGNLVKEGLLMGLLIVTGLWLLTTRCRRTSFAGRVGLPLGILGLAAWALLQHGIAPFGAKISAAGVDVLLEQSAGSYDTTVIRGTSLEAVNEWLAGNGFAIFEGQETTVMEDYLARKWVFFCAKVRTGGEGNTKIHPLTVRFPAEVPVYPMRLTESAGTVPLDLYVIGLNPVKDPSGRLRTVRLLDFSLDHPANIVWKLSKNLEHLRTKRKDPGGGDGLTEPSARSFPFVPEGQDVFLDTLMAGGTILTHLQATFKPGDDWADIRLETINVPVPQQQYFTRRAWLERVFRGTGWLLAVLALVGGLIARGATPEGSRPRLPWPPAIVLTLIAGLAFGVVAASRNVVIVPSEQVVTHKGDWPESAYHEFEDWLGKLAAQPATDKL